MTATLRNLSELCDLSGSIAPSGANIGILERDTVVATSTRNQIQAKDFRSDAMTQKCDELGVLCDVDLGALGVSIGMTAMDPQNP